MAAAVGEFWRHKPSETTWEIVTAEVGKLISAPAGYEKYKVGEEVHITVNWSVCTVSWEQVDFFADWARKTREEAGIASDR